MMKCEMDVKHVGDHECISCGKCVSACAQGAISLKCGKITLLGPETGKNADPEPEIRKRKKAGRVAWGIAIAVLVIALVLIVIGIINGGLEDVLAKGAAICTECVGLG